MLEVTLNYLDSGAECVNVYHGLIGDGTGTVIGAPNAADLKKIAGLTIQAWYNSYRVRHDGQLALTSVDVVQTNPVAPIGTSGVPDASVTRGAVTDGHGAQAAAPLIQWRTGIARRGANGRTFLPGMPSSDTDDGRTLATSRQTLWQEKAQLFYNGLIDPSTRSAWVAVGVDGTTPTIASFSGYTLGLKVLHTAGPLAATYSDIVAVRCASAIAIQRRRMK